MRAAAGGVPAKSGCAAQRSANCSMVAPSAKTARRSSPPGGRRARPRPRGPRWWRRARGARRGRAPPARRAGRSGHPSSSRRGRSARAPRPAGRPRTPRSSPAARRAHRRGRAGRCSSRRIAFAIQELDHRIPGAPRAGEAVQEDDGGGQRLPILTETIDTYLLLRAFVDELARCGLAGACTSPGSRSTPLVLTLTRQAGLETWSHVDERVGRLLRAGARPSRAGAPRWSRARAGRRPPTTCRP